MLRHQRNDAARNSVRALVITILSALGLATTTTASAYTPPTPRTEPTKLTPPGVDKALSLKALSLMSGWQFESNNAFANAGSAAVTLGDVNGDGFSDFAVGAPGYDGPGPGQTNGGAVFVFFGGPSGAAGTPNQSYYSTLGSFGATVAPAGDVNGDGYHDMLVGVPSAADGRAYVFLGSAGGLQASPIWQYVHLDGGFALANFGSSLAPAGDVNGDGYDDIVIGAYFSGDGAGAAFLFLGNAGGVGANPSWIRTGAAGDTYGSSVAGAGDVNGDGYADVIVGIPGADGLTPQGDAYYGAAYVYQGGPGGLALNPTTRLYGLQFGASYGAAVAGAGDVDGNGYADVAVGSPHFDAPGSTDAGRALIFPGSAGGVTTSPIWEEYGIAANAQFGASLGSAGDVNGDGLADVAVGVPSRVGGWPNNGYAVVVKGARAGIGILYINWFIQRGNAAGFGAVVGTAGDVNNDGFSDLIVSSPLYGNGQVEEGLAEIFYGAGDAPYTAPGQTINGGQFLPYYAWVTTSVGDVNGDGYGDVIVTAPTADYAMSDNGIVYLYGGSPSGLYFGLFWAGETASANFGYSAAAAGDVNDDGYGDLIIGAPTTGASGKAYVWHGGPFGPSGGAANWSVSLGTAGANFGSSVATAGDVNGDGYGDVIVGAPYDDNGQTNEGRAYLFLGSASGLSITPARIIESNQEEAHLGNSVASAGDVNRDGFSDVIIGAELWDQPLSPPFSLPDIGRATVHLGGASGLAASASWTVLGATSFFQFGHVVAPAGDVDGDGYSDVIVTALHASGSFTEEGEVSVYRGSAGGLSSTPHWSRRGGQSYANLGSSAASAGDVNGDGLSDVIVGAVFADRNGGLDNGEALVFAGPLTGGLATTPVWSFAGQQNYENVGHVVASAGDINGDGFSDVLAGAPGYTQDYYREGRALTFWGNALYGVQNTQVRLARMRRGDDSAPLALLGRAGSPPAMRLKALGQSAGGRTRVRLEWEVESLGVLFDGFNLGRSSWVDNGQSGIGNPPVLDSGSLGLPAGPTAHWRLRVASRSPYFPHSPWISPQGNGAQESDVRTSDPLTAVDEPVRPLGASLPVVAVPNPFNPRTSIRFELPREGQVRVELFDVRGRSLGKLLDEVRPTGKTELVWDGRDGDGRPVSSGAYYARVTASGEMGSVRLLLVR